MQTVSVTIRKTHKRKTGRSFSLSHTRTRTRTHKKMAIASLALSLCAKRALAPRFEMGKLAVGCTAAAIWLADSACASVQGNRLEAFTRKNQERLVSSHFRSHQFVPWTTATLRLEYLGTKSESVVMRIYRLPHILWGWEGASVRDATQPSGMRATQFDFDFLGFVVFRFPTTDTTRE